MKEEEKSFRLILADDNSQLRRAVSQLVAGVPGMQVVGEAADGQELLERLRDLSCDLVLMDLHMPRMDGLTALGHLERDFPDVRRAIYSTENSRSVFEAALERGVHGFILKDDDISALPLALQEIRQGRRFFSPVFRPYLK